MSRQAAITMDCWTLRAAERALLTNKIGTTWLSFVVLFKLLDRASEWDDLLS